ncbi:MAG: efflux RND transporter periplasmic adaptor subunit, partial [Deferrisomatales bacterium]
DEVGARRRSAEAAVDQAQAAVAASQAGLDRARQEVGVRELGQRAAASTLELARTEHGRVEKLVGLKVLDAASLDTARNALTQAEVAVAQAREAAEAARLGVKTAEAGVGEARARVELARSAFGELDAATAALEVQLGKATLRAPVSGRLEEHLVEPGEFVGAGDPVGRIYDLSRLRATVSVPDRYVAFLDPANPAASGYVAQARPGAVREVRATVRVPGLPDLSRGEAAGLELPARIARIAQAADPKSNTFAVELSVENPGGALRQGMIGQARIEYLTYPEAIVIPVAAVQMTDAGPRVLVVERTGNGEVVRVRDITPASVSQDELLVLQGLAEGERLIVAGWKGLVAGEEVGVVVADGVYQAAGGGENGR